MSFRSHIVLLLTIPVIGLIFTWTQPCKDSLFIGLCGFSRIILTISILIFFVIFSIITSVLRRKYLKLNPTIKKIVLVYTSGLIITLSPLILLLLSQRISAWNYSMNYLKMIQEITPKKLDSFEISNFSENAVINEEGKYDGIDVSFDLTVKKTGTYRGGLYIAHPEDFNSSVALFGRENHFSVIIEEGVPHRFSYFLKAHKNLLSEKIDGPYFFSLLMRFDDAGSEWYEYDPGIFITGDPRGSDLMVYWSMPIKVSELLKTKEYNQSEFSVN